MSESTFTPAPQFVTDEQVPSQVDSVIKAHENVLSSPDSNEYQKAHAKEQIGVLKKGEVSEDDLGSLSTPTAAEKEARGEAQEIPAEPKA